MNYPKTLFSKLADIERVNSENVKKTAKLVKKTIDGGGLLYVFGSGHSAMLVEEAFHRAGGLIPVYPVLHSFLSPYTTPKISGKLERLDGVAPILFARSGARAGDLFFIASNSGINSASIEMAMECKKLGIETVAFTSLEHSKSVKSRHASGKKLYEICDVALDNGSPSGDGLLDFDGVRVAALSSSANIFLYNWILAEVCTAFQKEGKELPVYKSANLPGGDEHNEKLERKYKDRITLL